MKAFPTLKEAAWVWARIAALSFGGPAGQIAVMHRILVEERRWLGEARFLHALNFCMLLPGPEAQQLATYIGWLMHGVRGALIAGGLFILPGAVAIMGLSWIYALWGEVGFVSALFLGLKAAVLAIVFQAVVRLGRRALRTNAMRGIAAASFVAIFAFDVPFPAIVALAAVIGWMTSQGSVQTARPDLLDDRQTLLGEELSLPPEARRDALRAGVAALLLWIAPVFALLLIAPDGVFTEIAVYFSKLAVLTFGGAYAALAWVAQAAVETYGWLLPGEMLDGLGMAETTPGPLIMVLQFVGFMGAMREAGWAMPLVAGTLGGFLTMWVTFAPCFAWIFLGAPFMETLRHNRRLSAALSAVSAAVVGVILNLALWFAMHVIWSELRQIEAGPISLDLPVFASVDRIAATLAAAALFAVFVLRWSTGAVIASAAAVGLVLHAASIV